MGKEIGIKVSPGQLKIPFLAGCFAWMFFVAHVHAERQYTTINGSKGQILKVSYSDHWEPVDNGIAYKKIAIISGESFVQSVLVFVQLDPRRYSAKILVEEKEDRGSGFFARAIAEKTGAALVINGSYFDENRRPLGYLVSDGTTINKKIATNWIYSGFFYVKNGDLFQAPRTEFQKELGAEQVLQAGPQLFFAGKPVKKINNLHASYFRSGIGVTRHKQVLVFATDTRYGGISWFELQQILELPVLECINAMNLDGGGSTQMVLAAAEKREFIDGTSKIPVAIGFFKK